MCKNTCSVFVSSPGILDSIRACRLGLIIAAICFVVLLVLRVPLIWCVVAFLFIGPLYPHTIYNLYLPYGIIFQDSSISVFYRILSRKKVKKAGYSEISMLCYTSKKGHFSRVVIGLGETKGIYRTITLSSNNNWNQDDLKRIVTFADSRGVLIQKRQEYRLF